ncbi:hypothetical protein WNY37_00360 [Henriciella sp. AS95]|uniref:hypothetical protein n=1 Tax=Henriciella sp. AS95 TaxID=3135782 RepID=UPI00316FCA21
MSALILPLPVEQTQRPEAEIINFPVKGKTKMSSNLQTSGWIACMAAIVLLVAATVISFAGGVHIEAGGVQMTLKASMEQGVHLVFAAAT